MVKKILIILAVIAAASFGLAGCEDDSDDVVPFEPPVIVSPSVSISPSPYASPSTSVSVSPSVSTSVRVRDFPGGR